MAICVDGNVVCFGGGCFSQTPTGIAFSGEAVADSFVDCRTTAGQGSTSGYSTLGATKSPFAYHQIVEKFPFSSDSPASSVGNLTQGRYNAAGTSSTTALYAAGGWAPGNQDRIDKMPFAGEGYGTDVGNLTVARDGPSGVTSVTSGYSAGGGPGSAGNVIDKFSFSSDADATDVGEMVQGTHRGAGISGTSFGYVAGGGPPDRSQIEKFPFSADSSSTDVAELQCGREGGVAGHNTPSHGYAAGGLQPGPNQRVNVIEKFPFASDTPASDIANLTVARRALAGQSSLVSGYSSGGQKHPAICNTIDKFPFASDANATDVGDLVTGKYGVSGHQV